MSEVDSCFLDANTYVFKFLRMLMKHIITEGVVGSGDLEVTEKGTPDMSVDISAGWGFVEGDQSAAQGFYPIYNDAVVNKAIAAADPANPRIDRVIAQVKDSTDIGGAEDEWELQVLTGTPAGSPSPPDLPDDALDLALVEVGAGVTEITDADITDQRSLIELSIDAGVDLSSYVTLTGAETLTNKRINRRVGSVASSASLTVNADSYDIYKVTALAEAITINAPSGTPVDGQSLILTFKDDGTARAINWNAIFVGIGVDLPATTVLGKRLKVGLLYSTDSSKWECPNAVAQEE